MRLEPGSLYDYEARAQQVLPHDYWDFIAGGSKDELTTQRNRSAFDAMSLRPRFCATCPSASWQPCWAPPSVSPS